MVKPTKEKKLRLLKSFKGNDGERVVVYGQCSKHLVATNDVVFGEEQRDNAMKKKTKGRRQVQDYWKRSYKREEDIKHKTIRKDERERERDGRRRKDKVKEKQYKRI